MDTVRIKVNGFEFPARADATILEATRESYGAKQWDIKVPTLYYLKDVQEEDLSGVCVVEVAGIDGLVNASTTRVADGMEIETRSEAVLGAQAGVVNAILAQHDQDCNHCHRTGNCELQELVRRLVIVTEPNTNKHRSCPIDDSAIIVRDNNKCVRCGRCVTVCDKIQSIAAIEFVGEGLDATVRAVGGKLANTGCVNCGQCIAVCPVGALYERNDAAAVREALRDPEKFVVVQPAPSVRASIGECFGFPVGSEVEGRLAAALHDLGFDRVYDTVFGADITVVEEAHEFVERVQAGGTLPMFTSCCPAWVKFCEQEFPQITDHLSSCKSPHQMLGATVKARLSQVEGIALDKIVVVSVMPCTAKKFEITRDDEGGMGVPDVDYALTTREIGRMINEAGIRFEALGSADFDNPLGDGSGAGVIFGATGGVMEAALRTAADILAGEELEKVRYESVRGVAGVKEATVEVAGKTLRVAAASGLANARKLAEQVAAGTSPYDFIEIMACSGGCVNGGGQPQQISEVRASCDLRTKRAAVLYSLDEGDTVRKSHENPFIKQIYNEVFTAYGDERAHELLHTTYTDRS